MTAEPRGNRYVLTQAIGRRAGAAMGVRSAAIRLGRAILERFVFAHTHTALAKPLRRLIERHYADDLSTLAPHFDAPLYLSQVRSPIRRRRATVAPLLHYRLTGWRETRAPSRHFDPVHYRADHLPVTRQEPLLHYLRVGLATGATPHRQPATTNLALQDDTRDSVLVFSHGRGGGSAHYLALMGQARAADKTWIHLRAITNVSHCVVADSLPGAPMFDLSTTEGRAHLIEAARTTCVTSLLINHVVDQETVAFDVIPALAAALRVPYDIVLHDYYAVCPRIDGVTGHGRFCGFTDLSDCKACILSHGAETGGIEPDQWRQQFRQLLEGARHITVPSPDHAQRLSALLDGLRITVAEPEPTSTPSTDRPS
jgi:hypothetical protein